MPKSKNIEIELTLSLTKICKLLLCLMSEKVSLYEMLAEEEEKRKARCLLWYYLFTLLNRDALRWRTE